jgi:DNA-binding GntR family transcriptional regulator
MTAGQALPGRPATGRPSAGVLAERLAAALVPREPGYLLPRRSALARRYQASVAEIDAALGELAQRRLVRLLPSGEAYRAGPAEYLVSPDGLPASSALIDPMGNHVSCRARRVSRLRAAADTAGALGLTPGAQICVCRTLWAADGEPAASAATYVPDRLAHLLTGQPPEQAGPGAVLAPPSWTARLGMLRVEMQPPERAAARRLRLPPGLPAVTVTARYDDRERAEPVALTVVALRPDRFRIVLDSARDPVAQEAQHYQGVWTRT